MSRTGSNTEYYWWMPTDNNNDPFWAFYELNHDGRLALRESFRPFACSLCRKLDHYAALTSAGLESFVPTSELDYQQTADGLACVSKRLWSVLADMGGELPRAFSIPDNHTHVVVWPTLVGHVDIEHSTVRFHGRPCERCGIHLEITYRPDSFLGVLPPTDVSSLFGLDVQAQGRNWRSMALYMRGDMCDTIKQHKPTGVSFRRCGQQPAITWK